MTSAASLTAAVDAALPQTQCTRCGYADCHSYARAIAEDGAPINQCPPGGAGGIVRLARITGRPVLALNPANGHEQTRQLAVIDEAACIGCTLCLKACPVDCIIGAPKAMHTVINDLCTGCELCIPACPVDCISLVSASGERTGWDAWSQVQADEAATRYAAHQQRAERDRREQAERLAGRTDALSPQDAPATLRAGASAKQSVIDAVLARARQRKA